MKKTISILIVIAGIILNLILYRAETQIQADPNDNVFQYSLVGRTNWVWENYGCPLSLSCLPNLIDHNVTYWAEGYSLPFYYSHLPQIAIVASFKMLVSPLVSVILPDYSLYQYYNLTKYLLLSFFPLPVFAALILVGVAPLPAALSAFFAAHLSTDGLYGIDPPSFLWRGYGLSSQLYAMAFMPLAVAFTYRVLKNTQLRFRLPDGLLASIFLTATTAGHLGIGIITLLTITPLVFMDLNKKNLATRVKKLSFIVCGMLFLLSYWIVPILLNNNYHIVSFWDPIWKFDSYGWYEVARQFISGEIFDWGRFPIITFIVLISFFMILLNSNFHVFALSFALICLLYFGRVTWGSLIDLIPGMKDFHQHRFIVGVHLTSLFLLPAFFVGLEKASQKLAVILDRKHLIPRLNILLFTTTLSLMTYFTLGQTVEYNSLNDKWIREANAAYVAGKNDFMELLDGLKDKPEGRIYAGRPGNWGKDFRIGSTQVYMILSVLGYDMTQWLPETWSMMSENDQNFDERVAVDYDLLNSRYIIIPRGKKQDLQIPESAVLIKSSGNFELYETASSGWFDIVESPMAVGSDKTNFANIVSLWHRSYPRTWKMHPVISVDKNPDFPERMQRILTMVNEINFREASVEKNIFSDFPFVFPESTPSGIIREEKTSRQSYRASIDVPQSCKNCSVMFKMSYHPNWQVKIDGKKIEKYAVFPMYVGASIGPGTHTIEVTHKPDPLKISLLILELIAVPAVLYFLFRKKPRT